MANLCLFSKTKEKSLRINCRMCNICDEYTWQQREVAREISEMLNFLQLQGQSFLLSEFPESNTDMYLPMIFENLVVVKHCTTKMRHQLNKYAVVTKTKFKVMMKGEKRFVNCRTKVKQYGRRNVTGALFLKSLSRKELIYQCYILENSSLQIRKKTLIQANHFELYN